MHFIRNRITPNIWLCAVEDVIMCLIAQTESMKALHQYLNQNRPYGSIPGSLLCLQFHFKALWEVAFILWLTNKLSFFHSAWM